MAQGYERAAREPRLASAGDACAPGSRSRRGAARRVRGERARRGPAYAGFSEHIADYHSDVTIEPDGTIEVHETIVYDFGVVPKHGIFRTIPVRTISVAQERVRPRVPAHGGVGERVGRHAGAVLRRGRRRQRADQDRRSRPTISGEHTYDIVYRVRGEMNAFADHDELVWNAVGTEWPVPIDKASATVHAPGRHHAGGCATGQFGATFPCDTATSSGPTAEFSKAPLNPYEGMTFTVALPKGAVVPSPTADPRGAVQLHVGVPGDARDRRHRRRRCWRCSCSS